MCTKWTWEVGDLKYCSKFDSIFFHRCFTNAPITINFILFKLRIGGENTPEAIIKGANVANVKRYTSHERSVTQSLLAFVGLSGWARCQWNWKCELRMRSPPLKVMLQSWERRERHSTSRRPLMTVSARVSEHNFYKFHVWHHHLYRFSGFQDATNWNAILRFGWLPTKFVFIPKHLDVTFSEHIQQNGKVKINDLKWIYNLMFCFVCSSCSCIRNYVMNDLLLNDWEITYNYFKETNALRIIFRAFDSWKWYRLTFTWCFLRDINNAAMIWLSRLEAEYFESKTPFGVLGY